jgi:hypothetical protein
MKTSIEIFSHMLAKVRFFSKQLNLKINKSTGRPLAITPEETIALSLFKQAQGIETKRSLWEIFAPRCSYKTLVVNMNKLFLYAMLVLHSIMRWNQRNAHLVKHTDSTDIPVCLTKNGARHRTMRDFATWAHGPKGWYFGLKMSITTDLKRNLLAVRFGSGNSDDRKTFSKMNKDLMGIFVADAGYISKDLERDFFIENKRILFAKPRANMKKLATAFQTRLYDTRMHIEINFRNLKMFYGLATSLPRSIDGYLGNYIYSLLAYVLA